MAQTPRRAPVETQTPTGRRRIVAVPEDITPSLLTSLHRKGDPFGIVLRGRETPEQSQISYRDATVAYYMPKNVRNAIGGAVSGECRQIKKLTEKDAVKAIERTGPSLDLLGVVTQGRLTYCNFGGGYLHPAPPPMLSDRPFVVGPKNIHAKHWLIQSCHSPYAWPGFPCLSLPISLMRDGAGVRSVICSSRAQTGIPMILELYFELVLGGAALGDVALALNRYSNDCGFERDPFFLLGDPDDRPCKGPTDTPDTELSVFMRVRRITLVKEEARLVRRILDNIQFAVSAYNFGFNRAPFFAVGYNKPESQEARGKQQNTLDRLRRDVEEWERHYHKRLAESPTVVSSGSRASGEELCVEAVWSEWTRSNERTLKETADNVMKLFRHCGGYYYWLGAELEGSYSISTVRRVCDRGGNSWDQYRQLRKYVGGRSSACNEERLCVVDDRDLFVRDVVSALDDCFTVKKDERDDGITVKLQFENHGTAPAWVFGFVSCADPNNLSRYYSKAQYLDVLKQVSLEGAETEFPETRLCVGETVEAGGRFCVDVNVNINQEPHPIFYLLIEVSVFVDFAWNWFSVTYRDDRAETVGKWLGSVAYRDSLRGGEEM